jgi:hypothetical protein
LAGRVKNVELGHLEVILGICFSWNFRQNFI